MWRSDSTMPKTRGRHGGEERRGGGSCRVLEDAARTQLVFLTSKACAQLHLGDGFPPRALTELLVHGHRVWIESRGQNSSARPEKRFVWHWHWHVERHLISTVSSSSSSSSKSTTPYRRTHRISGRSISIQQVCRLASSPLLHACFED